MCVHEQVSNWVLVCACMFVYVFMSVSVCVHVFVSVCVCVHVRCLRLCVCVSVCVSTCVCVLYLCVCFFEPSWTGKWLCSCCHLQTEDSNISARSLTFHTHSAPTWTWLTTAQCTHLSTVCSDLDTTVEWQTNGPFTIEPLDAFIKFRASCQFTATFRPEVGVLSYF